MDPLPCSQIVYRTIFKRSHLQDDGRPLAAEFERRTRDRNGLSVNYNVDVPDGCAPGMSGKKSVVSLHVGRIRDIDAELDVIPDSQMHANIVGVPFKVTDTERWEQIAAALVAMSRVVWRKPVVEQT